MKSFILILTDINLPGGKKTSVSVPQQLSDTHCCGTCTAIELSQSPQQKSTVSCFSQRQTCKVKL